MVKTLILFFSIVATVNAATIVSENEREAYPRHGYEVQTKMPNQALTDGSDELADSVKNDVEPQQVMLKNKILACKTAAAAAKAGKMIRYKNYGPVLAMIDLNHCHWTRKGDEVLPQYFEDDVVAVVPAGTDTVEYLDKEFFLREVVR